MRSSTAANCGLSPRCPAVISTDSGLRPCSQARCSFVVNPAPERPNPWSAGSGGPVPPGGSTCRSPFACPGGVLVGAGNGGVDADVPADQPGRISAGLEPGQDPGLGAVALPAAKQPVDGLPPPVAGGHISPGRTATRVRHRIPSMSRRLVRFGGRPDLVPVGSSGASIAHWVSVRSCRPVTGGDHEVSGGLVFFVEVPATGDLATFRSTRHHNSLDRRIRRLLKHDLAAEGAAPYGPLTACPPNPARARTLAASSGRLSQG